METSEQKVVLIGRVAEPENLKTFPVPVLTFDLNTVPVSVPGHINLSQIDINNHFLSSFFIGRKISFPRCFCPFIMRQCYIITQEAVN
jgi:hypothetical protein